MDLLKRLNDVLLVTLAERGGNGEKGAPFKEAVRDGARPLLIPGGRAGVLA